MIGTCKDLEMFIKCIAPLEWKVYEDFHTRPDPKEGDRFSAYVSNKDDMQYVIVTFIKVEFDPAFRNGVAFWYVFDNNGEEFRIWSINDVNDPCKLSDEERKAIYGFWRYCSPVN